MGSYRMADEPDDPLLVDEALCRKQRHAERLAAHLAITAITVGLWLPGVLVWLALAPKWMREFADGYRVQVRDGVLTSGNAQSSRSVPLDAIADASVVKGRVTVAVNGGHPLVLFGLRDPQAAVTEILRARSDQLRRLRGAPTSARVRVSEDAEPEVEYVADEAVSARRRERDADA